MTDQLTPAQVQSMFDARDVSAAGEPTAPTDEALHDAAARAADLVDARIAELVETIRAHRERIAALEAKNDAAKDELRALLEGRGENWADGSGYARLTAESTRISFDGKGLQKLIDDAPITYAWLSKYSKTSTVRGSIQDQIGDYHEYIRRLD